MEKYASLHRDYSYDTLTRKNLVSCPFQQFQIWFNQAQLAKLIDYNAMSLSTVDKTGQPSSRIVLMKDFSKKGLLFFSTSISQKGMELMANPKAALLFYWPQFERQVRFEGLVEKVSSQESDDYFYSRPLESRLGACASIQSAVIKSRQILENELAAVKAKFGDNPPRPEYWNGYRLLPNKIEFWQGGKARLHDRFVYKMQNGKWEIFCLSP